MPQTLSPGFKKLLREPAYCQPATLMPDGSPQNTQVWVDTDGEHILVNTAEARQKVKSLRLLGVFAMVNHSRTRAEALRRGK